MKKFIRFHRDKKAWMWAIIAGVVYFLFYLWSIQNIQFALDSYETGFMLLENWQDLIWKQRVALLWEPIALWVPIQGFVIFIAPPNIALALLLALLVDINILVAVYSYRMNKIDGGKLSVKGLLGAVPALLTGFACCAPTFVIAIASVITGFTVFFNVIRPWMIPLSILIMIWGYWYVSRNISIGRMQTYERVLKSKKLKIEKIKDTR